MENNLENKDKETNIESLLKKRNVIFKSIMKSYNENNKDFDISFYDLDRIEEEIYNTLNKITDRDLIDDIVNKNNWIKKSKMNDNFLI